MKTIRRIYLMMVLIALSYLVIGEVVLPKDTHQFDFYVEEWTTGWSELKPDGEIVPLDFNENYRNDIVITNTLPDTVGTLVTSLAIRGEKTEILIDGQSRLVCDNSVTRAFGDEAVEVDAFVNLNPLDAGKNITIKLHSATGIIYPVYLGTDMGILFFIFKNYGPELLVAVLTLLLGLISVVGSRILEYAYKRKVQLKYLGAGVSFAAGWIVCNSLCREIFFPNVSTISDGAYLMIMLIPIPILIYINDIQKNRYRRAYMFSEIICIVVFVVCCSLHALEIKSFYETFFLLAFSSLLAILILTVTIIIDILKKEIKTYYYVALGMLCVMVAASIQIVSFFHRTDVFSATALAFGLMLLLIFSVINSVKELIQMDNQKRQALFASEMKDKFLANMSHEIRTPINAVLGMDEMILRESSEEHIRDYALDIQSAGQSLLSIINDILDFSKIESGKMELVVAEYDFSSLVHDIVNMLMPKAEAKGLQFNLHLDVELPSRLKGDDVRIRQILVNILNNAIKYTQSGGIDFSISGTVSETKTGKEVLLHFSVKDTGIGIKQDDLGKLFVEFERIEIERNRNIEGTGLGMSITAQFLQLMGSKLQVESEYGKGSHFYFDLCQEVINDEPIGNLEERIKKLRQTYEYQVRFVAPEAKVLVVDDNAANRKVFRNLLKALRMQIDEADSGEACLEMVKEQQYDIIFLDHMMPEMDGIETKKHMDAMECNQSKDAVVVALTANAVAGSKEMYLREGFDEFMSKPIVPDKMEKLLQKYLPADKVIIPDAGDEQKILPKEPERDILADEDYMERLNRIPELNLEYARLFNKDPEFLWELVCDFYKMIEPEAKALEGFYDTICDLYIPKTEKVPDTLKKACHSYKIRVHTMKSSAAMIGAMHLSGVARLLEQAAEKENYETLIRLTPLFLKTWLDYKENMADILDIDSSEAVEEKKVFSKEEFAQACDKLMAAMEDMDIDVADEVMKEICLYDYPADTKEALAALQSAVDNLDGDGVNTSVKTLKDILRTKGDVQNEEEM